MSGSDEGAMKPAPLLSWADALPSLRRDLLGDADGRFDGAGPPDLLRWSRSQAKARPSAERSPDQLDRFDSDIRVSPAML